MEVAPQDKKDESAINGIYVRGNTGALVPLSSFATIKRTVGPTSINHVGQLQAVTVSFNFAPGTALGDATNKIEVYRDEIKLPASIITRMAVTPRCSRIHNRPGDPDHRSPCW